MIREAVAMFLDDVKEDLESPTTSTFLNKLSYYKQSVIINAQNLDADVDGLHRLKRAARNLESCSRDYQQNSVDLARSMEQLATLNAANCLAQNMEAEISTAISTFSVIFVALAELSDCLIRSIQNDLVFPLENLLKTDLKEKSDLKKHFEKALKDYDAKFTKLEREKKLLAKEAGLVRNEVSPTEFEEELRSERKALQLDLCRFYLKANRIQSKKGVELLQNVSQFYSTQESYFHDSLKVIEEFRVNVSPLGAKLSSIKDMQDEERKRLLAIQEKVRSSPGAMETVEKENYNPSTSSLTSPRPSSMNLTTSRKSGYLLKRSEGKMKRMWQRRRCEARDGLFCVYHSDEAKTPVKLQLATCKIKPSFDDKKGFDLICYNRTYHFQAEKESEAASWVSYLEAIREEAQSHLIFNGSCADGNVGVGSPFRNSGGGGTSFQTSNLEKALITKIFQLPGNEECCDCGSLKNDVTWLSTNLGGLYCIDCSGIHRELGVHISRIQSLSLDHVPTSQLLIAAKVGNAALNSVFEANLPDLEKPQKSATMQSRKTFIHSKYVDRKYMNPCLPSAVVSDMIERGIRNCDMIQLVRAFAASIPADRRSTASLSSLKVLPEQILSRALQNDNNGSYLPVIAFMLQNGMVNLNESDDIGDTAVGMAIRLDKPECLKLILLHRDVSLVNSCSAEELNPAQLAKKLGRTRCSSVITAAEKSERSYLENVIIALDDDILAFDFNRLIDEAGFEFSDDERLDSISIQSGTSSPIPSDYLSCSAGSNYRLRSSLRSRGQDGLVLPTSGHSAGREKLSLPGVSSNALTLPHNLVGGVGVSGLLSSSSLIALQHQQSSASSPKILASNRISAGSIGNMVMSNLAKYDSGTSISDVSSSSTLVADRSVKSPKPTSDTSKEAVNGHCSDLAGKDIASQAVNIPRRYPGAQRVLPSPTIKSSTINPPTNGLPSAPGRMVQSRISSLTQEQSESRPPPVPPKPKPLPAPRNKIKKRARALYDCEADNEDELSFRTGDVIVITKDHVEEEDDQWMEGFVESREAVRGIFPVAFVEMMGASEQSFSASP